MNDQKYRKYLSGIRMLLCFANAMLIGTKQHCVEAFAAASTLSMTSYYRSCNVKNDRTVFSRYGTTSIIRLDAEPSIKTPPPPPPPPPPNKSSNANVGMQKRLSQLRPVFLSHERDFFRQGARLESMDSYVLVSTLTASMSFGCLVGFQPKSADAILALLKLTTITNKSNVIMLQGIYRVLCMSIQVASAMSALCGLYATVIFSLTILYGKSALGAERDREYDKFLRRTVRSRVNGARCFTLSLALFALTTFLVLLERTFLSGTSLPVSIVALTILYRLYKDWKELSRGRDQIFRDKT